MISRKLIFVIVFFISATFACLEPSDRSLFIEGEQVLVIEGRVLDSCSLNKVFVTKSVSGDNLNHYEAVNNAQVKLFNETTGNEELLEYKGNGVHESSGLIGTIGHTYRLEVDVLGDVYMSTETIASKPKIEGAYIGYLDDLQFGKGYFLFYHLLVNPDSIGYYKVEITVNDSLYRGYEDLLVFEDRLYKENQLLKLPVAFNLQDTLKLCIYSLSENMYNYYMALNRQTTNLYSNIQPPVVNPENNLFPSALGYFQASSVYRLDTVITDVVR